MGPVSIPRLHRPEAPNAQPLRAAFERGAEERHLRVLVDHQSLPPGPQLHLLLEMGNHDELDLIDYPGLGSGRELSVTNNSSGWLIAMVEGGGRRSQSLMVEARELDSVAQALAADKRGSTTQLTEALRVFWAGEAIRADMVVTGREFLFEPGESPSPTS